MAQEAVTARKPGTAIILDGLERPLVFGRSLRSQFLFEDDYTNLNHGSFGTYPQPVRLELLRFQAASEARPDRFIRYEYPSYLDLSRQVVSNLLNTHIDNIVFIPNVTMGINIVLRSLRFEQGDKILFFNFAHEACVNTVRYIEETTPVQGVKIDVEFPCEKEQIVRLFSDAIRRAGGGLFNKEGNIDTHRNPGESRARVAIFDTIVSLPGLRLPFEELLGACKELGVMSLVDAAHGIGHIPLDLTALDPDFLVSNCYKWFFVPRGCAAFYVPKRNQHLITNIPTSFGFIPSAGLSTPSPPSHSSKPAWVNMFEFAGTIDTSPYLCIQAANGYRQRVLGGELRIMRYIQDISQCGAQIIAEMLGTEVLDNTGRTLTKCALQNVRLPIGTRSRERYISPTEREGKIQTVLVDNYRKTLLTHYLQQVMSQEFNTFIPVILYRGNWYARVSGQVYLDEEDFRFGGRVLLDLVGRVRNGLYISGAEGDGGVTSSDINTEVSNTME